MTSVDQVVQELRATPTSSALLFDFDGTLSPLVDDPELAAPAPGAVEHLVALAATYRTVGILSGRPVSFLAGHLPEPIELSGLYGLESRHQGQVRTRADADAWRPVVGRAAERAEAQAAAGAPLQGMRVERKGLSVTLHVRTRPELAAAVEAFATEVALELGLDARPAKMSVELHPPVHVDKGTALRDLAAGAALVLYVGDDIGDLPAYAALQDLAGDGVAAVGVAVDGPELPDAVRAAAQVVLPSQAAIVDLLAALRP